MPVLSSVNNHKKKFLDALVKSRFRLPKDVRAVFDKREKARRLSQKQPRFLKFVHNGQFVRIAIPPKQPILPNLPKLPQTILEGPKPFVVPTAESAPPAMLTKKAAERQDRIRDIATQLRDWWHDNWAVLVLNLGSIASLIGFTRSDVLELRTLSVTGSLTGMIYHLSTTPLRYTPIAWSFIFATVNGIKIYQVIQERKGAVKMTQNQESVYSRFFMPHGVTPKQFEVIWNKAEILKVPKGATVIKEGDEIMHVSLVIDGETRAQSKLGRRLTAVSFKHLDDNEMDEEDRISWTSGAWIGEIVFLNKLWNKQQNEGQVNKQQKQGQVNATDAKGDKSTTAGKTSQVVAAKDSETKEEAERRVPHRDNGEPKAPQRLRISRHQSMALTRSSAMSNNKALYNIVAVQDSVVMRWKHEDMEELMTKSSAEMRGAMTRAMTAAIVGKVINFSVSTSQRGSKFGQIPNWSSWLGDWTNGNRNDVQSVKVVRVPPAVSDQALLEESPPGGPIKKFG